MKRTSALSTLSKLSQTTVLLCLLLCAPLLTACTDRPKTLVLEQIPDEYFECKDWPTKPPATATESDGAKYVIKGHGAWKSCKGALNDLKGMKTSGQKSP